MSTSRLAPLPMARVAPCPHCGQLPRSWGEMDMHLRFTCPVIRAPRAEVES